MRFGDFAQLSEVPDDVQFNHRRVQGVSHFFEHCQGFSIQLKASGMVSELTFEGGKVQERSCGQGRVGNPGRDLERLI